MQKRCTYLLIFCLTNIMVYAQGPLSGFMPKVGQLDLAVTRSTETYQRFFTDTGETIDRQLDGKSYSAFLEYGLDKRTALVVTAPYIEHTRLNIGWQDASIWLKHRNERTKKPLGYTNFITAIGLSFPLSQYPNDNPLAIGRRATTFHGRLLWQYEANYGWFINLQSGLDFQFAPVAQAAIPLLIRGGFGAKYFYTDLWLERYQSLNGNADNTNLSAGPGSSWTKTGATLYAPIQPWVGVFVSGALVLGGKGIGQSRRLNMGAVFRIGGK